MWAIKGTFLGISIFAVGVTVFMLAFFRSIGPLLAGPGQHWAIDIRSISLLTVGNPWFWAAFVACIVIWFGDCAVMAGEIFSCLLGSAGGN